MKYDADALDLAYHKDEIVFPGNGTKCDRRYL